MAVGEGAISHHNEKWERFYEKIAAQGGKRGMVNEEATPTLKKRAKVVDGVQYDFHYQLGGGDPTDLGAMVQDGLDRARLQASLNLAQRFGVPPINRFDSMQGYWQTRKRYWTGLGIKSEVGRGENLTYQIQKWAKKHNKNVPYSDTSIFDPVLTEMNYAWFTKPGYVILDPFAGGSVRGIIAAAMGRRYIGIDLSAAQVESNQKQWEDVKPYLTGDDPPEPTWICGDSRDVLELAPGEYDHILTCPPYYNLEVYSKDPKDLSNAPTYGDFAMALAEILFDSTSMLKENRWATIVVGPFRDKRYGFIRDMPGDTVYIMNQAGLCYYNTFTLLNIIGSLAIRVAKQMIKGYKAGSSTQSVLNFWKGDPRRVNEIMGDLDTALIRTEEKDTEALLAAWVAAGAEDNDEDDDAGLEDSPTE